MKFNLGEPKLNVDLKSLIDGRMLIQANSGGGKSWTIRRILEQTHGHVQQFVIDPEGEFGTLREKYDYVYAARSGGDTAAHPRSAKLLAERLLELGVSAILDIYDLKAHERVSFVRSFLEAMIDAKKELWHPVMVIVDEAHVYCPQKGEAESAGAVIDLCTRGRKRGYCAVLATQRLSKLHKDAAAELNNKLIGRTGLDVDMARAGEELGFNDKEQRLSLRSLPKGDFYAFGPAIAEAVTRVHIGDVKTRHPESGSRIAFTPPPPTDKVKAMLPKLADLPAEAEERHKTTEQLKKELATVRRELTVAQKAQPKAPPPPKIDVRPLQARVTQLEQALERLMKFVLEINAQDFFKAGGDVVDKVEVQKALNAAAQQAVRMIEADLITRRKAFEKWRRQGEQILEAISRLVKQDVKVSVAVKHNEPFTVAAPPRPTGTPRTGESNGKMGRGEKKILAAIAQHEEGVDREQITVLTGYKRSSRDTYLQRIFAGGYAALQGDRIVATHEGVAELGDDFEPLPTGAELRDYWLGRLTGGERKLFGVLVEAFPEWVQRAALDDATGYQRSSRDTYLQRLAARKIIEVGGRSEVRASARLFDE